jgi:hypothetical protein
MKKTVKVNFTNFWTDFKKKDNIFFNLLLDFCNVEISDEPDILFYSVNDDINDHKSFNCIKVFYSGEPISPNFNECDYSFSFDFIDSSKHFRLPGFVVWPMVYDNTKTKNKKVYINSYERLLNKEVCDELWERNFCNFIYSNPNCQKRNDFFEKLSRYKKVDSGGNYKNNIGGPIFNKLEFQSKYKFSIAFENTEYLGYTSEKIANAMLANSIPIYWGNPLISKDFNTESFINYYDFKNEKDLIDYIIFLDNDKEEYLKKLNKSWLIDNKLNQNFSRESIKNFLVQIVNKINKNDY